MVGSSSSPVHDFQLMVPPTAGVMEVGVAADCGVVVSDVEADEHPAMVTNKTEAISVLRST
jgi:hypothetical protein